MASIGLRAYAKLKGVSPEAVNRAIKSGRLVKSVTRDKKNWPRIDPKLADKEWEENTHQGNSLLERKKRAENESAKAQASPSSSYANSKAIRENYLARLAKLDYEERSGKLVDAEAVKKEAFKVARTVRDGLLNIPDRVAAEFAGLTKPHEIHVRLSEEIRKALEALQE